MSMLVNKPFQNFTAQAVDADGHIVDINFAEAIEGYPAVLFFYPFDFTFVCPTELVALDKAMTQFEAKGVKVFTVSVDSPFVHQQWRDTPINSGGIGPVRYTMVSDTNHDIMYKYGVADTGRSFALRGTFIINREGIVVAQSVNSAPLGRSIPEILRLVDAQEHFEKHGEVCPAGWTEGDNAMTPTADGLQSFLDKS